MTRSSQMKTGTAYRTCSAASRQRTPSKWGNLELDSTPFTTSQVRLWLKVVAAEKCPEQLWGYLETVSQVGGGH